MLSYEKRSYNDSSSGGLGSFGERSEYTTRTIGTVTLPVPGGISDTNSVEWGGDLLPAAVLEIRAARRPRFEARRRRKGARRASRGDRRPRGP